MNKKVKYILIIVCAVAILGVAYYLDNKFKLPANAINKLDAQYYNTLLSFIKSVPWKQDMSWFYADVALYQPGGARANWVTPDKGSGKISLTGILSAACNELSTLPEWQGAAAAQAFAIGQQYQAAQVLAGA